MNSYQRLFELFPNAISIAIAGIYGLKKGTPDDFQLSDSIYIMASREEFETLYHPRMNNQHWGYPNHYLVAIAPDKRYAWAFKQFQTIEDVLGSISIAHQALCIFHNEPYALGQVEGFLVDSMCSYGISNPKIAGRNSEFNNDLFKQDTMFHDFHSSNAHEICFDERLVEFFKNIATAYVENQEKRWLLSAKKYTSGMNQLYAEDAILDFSIALESLLALDKEQISFKLRLYLSLLVGDSYNERLDIYNDLKKFYNFRSKLVHGNTLSLKDEEIKLIKRVGKYISKALNMTLGKNIQKDVLPELEFMSLLGAPRLIKEKTQCIVTEKEIVDIICKCEKITEMSSYKAYISKSADPDNDITELLVEITLQSGEIQRLYASMYIFESESLSGYKKMSYWLSENEHGYFYNVVYGGKDE